MSLLYIAQQLTIYGGFSLLLLGILGNGMNIFIFSSVRTYRTTPCTFYFLIASIHNMLYILINLTSRIVITGYEIDLTRSSVVWCKTRQFFLVTLSTTALTCSCLASIDQFFVTSRHVYLRRCSNLKWAHRIVFIVLILWYLHGTLCFFFFHIPANSNACVITNSIFAIYVQIYLILDFCTLPILVMVLFGYLTYRNIRQTRVLVEEHADRQLTRMTLIQVSLVVISMTPYTIISVYNLVTSGVEKDANRLLIEFFMSTIVSLVIYIYYVGSCYIFLISSSRFRRTVKDRIFWRRIRGQVIPLHALTIAK